MARCSGCGNGPHAEGMTMGEENRGDLTLGQQRFLERMQEAQKEGLDRAPRRGVRVVIPDPVGLVLS